MGCDTHAGAQGSRVVASGGPFGVQVKRFQAPATLYAVCPLCGTEERYEFDGSDYLNYPTANEAFDFQACCSGCDANYPVRLMLTIAVEVVS